MYEGAKFGKDLLEAAYKALPKELQKRKPTNREMADAVYKHFDKIDFWKYLENALWAYAMEKFGGKLEKVRSYVSQQTGMWKAQIRIPSFY